MAIANWSARRILWLWIGVAGAYAVFITVGALRIQRDRRAFDQTFGISPAPAETSGVPLSPGQLARRDSLVDSLKRVAQTYLDSPEGKAMAGSIRRALDDGLPRPRELVLVGLAFVAPAILMLILTVLWITKRRAAFRPAGA
jgi:hypothetical protein